MKTFNWSALLDALMYWQILNLFALYQRSFLIITTALLGVVIALLVMQWLKSRKEAAKGLPTTTATQEAENRATHGKLAPVLRILDSLFVKAILVLGGFLFFTGYLMGFPEPFLTTVIPIYYGLVLLVGIAIPMFIQRKKKMNMENRLPTQDT